MSEEIVAMATKQQTTPGVVLQPQEENLEKKTSQELTEKTGEEVTKDTNSAEKENGEEVTKDTNSAEKENGEEVTKDTNSAEKENGEEVTKDTNSAEKENGEEVTKDTNSAEKENGDGKQDTDSKWYILQSYAGQEKKAHELILFHLQMEKCENSVDEIFIPSEEITTKVRGKERKNTSTYFPGYILIKMRLTDEIWHTLQQIPKISGFIGKYRNQRPEAVPEIQIQNIKKQIHDGVKQTQVDSTYQIGQNVIIIEGPFSEFVGHIDQINTEKNSLVVLVNIFGRSVPVEVTFDKIRVNQ